MDMQGKVAFITGGASGIGFSMAKAFGAEGMSVMVADIEAGPMEKAVAELRGDGIRAEGVVVDVRSRASVEAAAEATLNAFGKVHVVCNNAGVGAGGAIGEVPHGDWDWVIDVNLKGVVYGVETFAPLIARHGEGGHIVNTGSMAGMVSPARMEPYAATKFAVVAMSEGWGEQLAPTGIGVSVLCPGWVKTRIDESRRNRHAEYGSEDLASTRLEESAALIQSGMSSDIVAARVVEAVKAGDFYIFTHPEMKPSVTARFDRILAGFDAAVASSVLAAEPGA